MPDKESMKIYFGYATVGFFFLGVFWAFDDFNSSKGVIFMLGALVLQNWKKEIK